MSPPLAASHEASGQGECGQRSTWRGTHRFYPHDGKSGERRAGVSPEMSLGRCPEQPHNPAEISLPGAAQGRLGSPNFPRRPRGWDPGQRDCSKQRPSPLFISNQFLSHCAAGLPTAADRHTHLCYTLTHPHMHLGRCTHTHPPSLSCTQPCSEAHERAPRLPTVSTTHLLLPWLAWVPSEGGDLETW